MSYSKLKSPTPNSLRIFDLPAGNYRAWVLPFHKGQRRNWSAPIQFSVGMNITGLAPQGKSGSASPTISWDAVNGDVTYELWVNQQNGTSGLINEKGLSSTSFQAGQLADGLYRFWVRAKFANGVSTPWSDAAEFYCRRQCCSANHCAHNTNCRYVSHVYLDRSRRRDQLETARSQS